MPTEERMTVNERHKYLHVMKSRYQKASRKEQSALLTEMEHLLGAPRSCGQRRLNGSAFLERRLSVTVTFLFEGSVFLRKHFYLT